MHTITCQAAQADLSGAMDRVCHDHKPLIVMREREPSVVMLSLEDYRALQETEYLFGSLGNARRLCKAVAALVSREDQAT